LEGFGNQLLGKKERAEPIDGAGPLILTQAQKFTSLLCSVNEIELKMRGGLF